MTLMNFFIGILRALLRPPSHVLPSVTEQFMHVADYRCFRFDNYHFKMSGRRARFRPSEFTGAATPRLYLARPYSEHLQGRQICSLASESARISLRYLLSYSIPQFEYVALSHCHRVGSRDKFPPAHYASILPLSSRVALF